MTSRQREAVQLPQGAACGCARRHLSSRFATRWPMPQAGHSGHEGKHSIYVQELQLVQAQALRGGQEGGNLPPSTPAA